MIFFVESSAISYCPVCGEPLSIPNWNVGTELSSLTDLFWNEERLRHYSRMKKADACTIVSALKVLAEHGCMN